MMRTPCSSWQAAAWAPRSARRRSADPDRIVERLRALGPDALSALAEREREILGLYYGLRDEGPHSRSEIAARVGLSEWQVRHAISRAIVGLLWPEAAGERRWVAAACRACGRAFVGERGQAYCSPTCFAAARWAGLAAGPWRQPAFAARVAATKRARLAQSAEYRSIAARLRALDPAGFDALPERDRAIVRLSYGLEGGEVCTHGELAVRFGLHRETVGQILRKSLRLLLDRDTD